MLWEAKADFNQPVRVAVAQPNNTFYVLDTGNNRGMSSLIQTTPCSCYTRELIFPFSVRVLKSSGEVQRDISSPCLEGGSAVGMALLPESSIALLNWKTRSLSIINAQVLHPSSFFFIIFSFTGSTRQEYCLLGVSISNRSCCRWKRKISGCRYPQGTYHSLFLSSFNSNQIFVLDSSLRPVFSFPANDANQHQTITCVAVGIDDDILVGMSSFSLPFLILIPFRYNFLSSSLWWRWSITKEDSHISSRDND